MASRGRVCLCFFPRGDRKGKNPYFISGNPLIDKKIDIWHTRHRSLVKSKRHSHPFGRNASEPSLSRVGTTVPSRLRHLSLLKDGPFFGFPGSCCGPGWSAVRPFHRRRRRHDFETGSAALGSSHRHRRQRHLILEPRDHAYVSNGMDIRPMCKRIRVWSFYLSQEKIDVYSALACASSPSGG